MRFSFPGAFVAAILLGQTAATHLTRLEERATASIPTCALECVVTLVSEYCGSLTNTTCLCTDTTLTGVLTLCVLSACNVTESFQLQKYQADVCDVPNDDSRLEAQLLCYYTLPALATFFLIARMYCRVAKETVGKDDWMMVAAWVFYMIDVGAGQGMMINKFGLHTYQLTTKQMENSLMYFYLCELWYIVAITLTKLSLLLFFRRIFPQQGFNIATWVVGVYTAVSNTAVFIALVFQCVPLHGAWTNWEYKVYPVKCVNTYAVVYFAAGNSIFQDVVILILPINIILHLQLTWQKKLNVLVMFSVGVFVILCSILRLPSLIKLKTSIDPSWDQGSIGIWTNIEISVGIICGCLPACRSLIGHIFPFLKMTFSKSSNNGSGPSAGYASRKTPSNKLGGNKGDHFVELHDRNDLAELGIGRGKGGISGGVTETISDEEHYMQASMHSNESKVPFGMNGGGRFGASVDISAGEEGGRGSIDQKGIVMTRDIDQTSAKR